MPDGADAWHAQLCKCSWSSFPLPLHLTPDFDIDTHRDNISYIPDFIFY